MAVLNKHKLPNKEIPAGAVYIGRGSKWGNPFVMSDRPGFDRKGVCDKYREHLWQQIKAGEVLLNDLAALHGKDLVCFCAPCQCHGHTLEKAAEWASQTLNLFEG